MSTQLRQIVGELEAMADPQCVAGLARYGVRPKKILGISITKLMEIEKRTGKNHDLAIELWRTGIHDARLLACLIDDPRRVTEAQMEKWVRDFDSWVICDGCCGHLFDRTPFAYQKADEWSRRKEEYVKRAGFVLMACLAVHDKKADDEVFLEFLQMIRRGSNDERNYVRKAVNWALRTIGKRNLRLHAEAIKTGERIRKLDSKAAKWIASDALRELRSEEVMSRLKKRRLKSLH